MKGERSNAFLCLVFSSLVLVLALNNKEEVGREGNYSMLTDPILFIACSIRPTKNLTGILHKQRTYTHTRVQGSSVCVSISFTEAKKKQKRGDWGNILCNLVFYCVVDFDWLHSDAELFLCLQNDSVASLSGGNMHQHAS